MIQYIKRNKLDIEKYDTCIQNSINSRIYAFSYYLDIVADNWDALVLNDYEAVMPLPWRSKYFIKYIYPPCWTQQLGVFSLSTLTESLVDDFLKTIPRKFLKTTIQFNSGNITSLKTHLKTNYILQLNNNYDILSSKFNKNRKRVLKKSNTTPLVLKKTNLKKLISIAKSDYSFLPYTDSDYRKLKMLSSKLVDTKNAIVYGVFSDDAIIGGVLLLKDKYRITYLFSTMTDDGKKLNGASFIISNIIKQYENTQYILDFEGSMISGIANFFKSFGAIKENYYLLETNVIQRSFI